jgi:hypothetical protein
MIGSLMMCVSVVVLLVGILAGIATGIQQNFTLAAAHAHPNLIGGVLLFLLACIIGWSRLPEPRASPRCGAGSIDRRDPVSGRRCRRAVEGRSICSGPDRGIADRGRGDGAVRCDRVPDLAGLTPPLPAATIASVPPSPFEPIHGIVRQIDSLRPKRAQNMKSHAQTIENQC